MQIVSYACVEFAYKYVQLLEHGIFEKNLEKFLSVERLVVVNQFASIQTNGFVGSGKRIGTRSNVAI